MKAFAALYRRLDSETSTRAKQAAMVEFFAAAKADPLQWASAAWTVYFLAGGKPRQTAPTRLLWRLAVEGSGYPDWLCAECYGAVGDLAEMLSLLLPEGAGGEEVSLDVWMRERLLPLPSLGEEERYARLKQWVGELPANERLAFFKLITGELRVGVSRLQAVKALAEVAGVDEGRMAQRLIGYSQARRIPTAADFEALIGEVLHAEAEALDAGKPYPFYLAQSWSRPLGEMLPALGPPSEWIVEWKFDGIRAQLLKRGENWRLWSRGEELISDAYPDLEPLARALPSGAALDGELVVLIPPAGDYPADSLDGLALFASLQQRLGRKIVSEKTMRELPVAFIAYDLLESEGRDIRAKPQHERRALLEQLVDRLFMPSDFGFAIDVHAHEPDTIYVVPIKSDSEHFPPDGKLRVYRSRTGGNEWEALTKGLPQNDCYVNVLRDAMAVDSLDSCGVYFGTTGGQVYASANAGDSWAPIVRDLPAVLSVEVQTLQ